MRESRYNIWERRDATHDLFNVASGVLRQVAPGDHAALKGFLATRGETPCSLPFLLSLCQDGMLVADEIDEVEGLRLRYNQAITEPANLTLTILTSSGCNFACQYCYETKRPSVMGAEVQQSILRYVDERLPGLGRLHVCWFGGEPLLGQHALFGLSAAFLERCSRAGVRYEADIITNGYLLDAATCRRLADHGVKTAQITLDGPPEVHDGMRPLAGGQGTFWRIVENLHPAVEQLQVTVRVNVDGSTYDRAGALLDILASEGLASKLVVYLGQLRWDTAAPASARQYDERCFERREFAQIATGFSALAAASGFRACSLPEPTALHCSALHRGDLVVGSAGELYRCLGLAANPGAVIGDIRNYRWPESSQDVFEGYDPFADAECRNCIAFPVCMGGCPRDAVSSEPSVRANRCHEFRYSYCEAILCSAEAETAKLRTA